MQLLTFASAAENKKAEYGKTKFMCNCVAVNKRTLMALSFSNDVERNISRIAKSKLKEPAHLVLLPGVENAIETSALDAVCASYRIISVTYIGFTDGERYKCFGEPSLLLSIAEDVRIEAQAHQRFFFAPTHFKWTLRQRAAKSAQNLTKAGYIFRSICFCPAWLPLPQLKLG